MSSQQQVDHLLQESDKCKVETLPRRPTQSIPNKKKMSKEGFEKKKKMTCETKEKACAMTVDSNDECVSPRRHPFYGGSPMPCMMIAEELNKRNKREPTKNALIREKSKEKLTMKKSETTASQHQLPTPVGGFKKPSEIKKATPSKTTSTQHPLKPSPYNQNNTPQRPVSMYCKPPGNELKRERSGAKLMAEQITQTPAFKSKPIVSEHTKPNPILPTPKQINSNTSEQKPKCETENAPIISTTKSPKKNKSLPQPPMEVLEMEEKTNSKDPQKKPKPSLPSRKQNLPPKKESITTKPPSTNEHKPKVPEKKEEPITDFRSVLFNGGKSLKEGEKKEENKPQLPEKKQSHAEPIKTTTQKHERQSLPSNPEKKERYKPTLPARNTPSIAQPSKPSTQPKQSCLDTSKQEKEDKPTPPPKKDSIKPKVPEKKEEPITDFRSVLFNGGKSLKEGEKKEETKEITSIKPTTPPKNKTVGSPTQSPQSKQSTKSPLPKKEFKKEEEPITDFRSVLFNGGKSLMHDN
ncbi:hypothetical protein EHI8A_045180 [Entamoeba histolytica HM-1:IMSS-B]|uniref:Uncharacterized protein n=6 Tax=Entamoeba histolytica TaxID=5759 RepID=C4M8B3_ENTH1|nr:hypothetical protein EHI_058120 [Entamoeba histolytica HM-1:IMSS]EMD46412.1 Hypothetical protein EHI5A_074940 [Entamoeba histolytica KU27]EMH75728.1 hypothetical protein EHI8A_045180 [Entamoeba histolytica HM-1:IMSS-B]EMS13083.1 hypothetical protein KM1_090040 [Entamoeba histolytica HM-3:IMSS]ENY59981.1 hypothetical protein EHI7A_045390 [Entamoeba histolytica HM-1:IMSS-A]GAT97823.1 hypothetical protein CL6EHI_058120 [Entamoeba histolytica]|eukprot:XP_651167.1 hypothetical protein EHI_058120 [Entamoeba histolytica HM-1:IMSS]